MQVDNVSPKHILLVEDRADVREATCLLLSAIYECSITEASDGREALDLYVPGRFDLVVTDYDMPHLNGHQLAETIRRIDPGQRIVMVTAYPDEGFKAPVDAVVAKPFFVAQLRAGVEKALAKTVGEQLKVER